MRPKRKTRRDDLAMPEGLDDAGKLAHEIIVGFLNAKGLIHTDNCRPFYSPAEWRGLGRRCGEKAKLVVDYDHGDLFDVFEPGGNAQTQILSDELMTALEEHGLKFEANSPAHGSIEEIKNFQDRKSGA